MVDRFDADTVPFGLTTYRTPIHSASIPPVDPADPGPRVGKGCRQVNIGRRHIQGITGGE